MANFFISYSRKDSKKANLLRNHIYKIDTGHEAFLDVKSMKPGTHWKTELKNKIKSCDYFIYIHSVHSLKSKYIKSELRWVCESELNTGIRKLFVYRINNAEIIPEIANYQILDATDNFTIDFYKLMQGVNSENSFYSVDYKIKLKDEWWYEGKIHIEAPINFLSKIQMVEYRFDYGWDLKNRIIALDNNKKNLSNKFEVTFTTKYHFTLFVMLYLWNTKELSFVKKIHLSH